MENILLFHEIFYSHQFRHKSPQKMEPLPLKKVTSCLDGPNRHISNWQAVFSTSRNKIFFGHTWRGLEATAEKNSENRAKSSEKWSKTVENRAKLSSKSGIFTTMTCSIPLRLTQTFFVKKRDLIGFQNLRKSWVTLKYTV